MAKTIDTSPNPEEEIKADDWNDMSVPDLHQQLHILGNRMSAISNSNNPTIIKQLQKGIDQLQLLINKKTIDTIIY